jgi:predicted PhzF superfamily epimerase YddE/YHI9
MSSGPLPAVLIEAFSNGPFGGNGATVVALTRPMSADWMQAVAASLRQSETAFLLKIEQGWMLRWFTPACEVPLCGHATLAALLALAHWRRLAPGERTWLHSRSGPLEVELPELQPGWGAIVLPSGELHPKAAPAGLTALLRDRLGCEPEGCWSSELGYWVVLLPREAPLASMHCLAQALEGPLRQGLVLMQGLDPTAGRPLIGAEPADYQLRFFAPGLGIPEDPVTGSAHALVAPWWQKRLGRPLVRGWQCSDRPGGMVCEAVSSAMIRLTGSGHLLWDGTLRTASEGWALAAGRRGDREDAPLPDLWSAWQTATHLPCSTASGDIPS